MLIVTKRAEIECNKPRSSWGIIKERAAVLLGQIGVIRLEMRKLTHVAGVFSGSLLCTRR
jgi:hypothetical protein